MNWEERNWPMLSNFEGIGSCCFAAHRDDEEYLGNTERKYGTLYMLLYIMRTVNKTRERRILYKQG